MIKSLDQNKYQELLDCSNKEYVCGQCGNGFENGDVLKQHMKATHNLDLKSYIQQYEYIRDDILQVDSITEDLQKDDVVPNYFNLDSVDQYICEKCVKTFSKKRSLRDHMRYKHGEASSCKLCSKTFLSKVKLKCHESIHTSHKYFCNICDRGFFMKQNKARHMKSCVKGRTRRKVSSSDHKCELFNKY